MKKISVIIFAMILVMNVSGCKKEEAAKTVANNGIINFMTGDVTATTDGKTIKVNVGDAVTQGMVIKTGAKSVVDIYFNSSVIRILEKSSVVMKELVKDLQSNKELSEFYVENGKLFSKVSRKLVEGEKFSVTSPTAVAGVRGTEFLVEEENGKSKISCIEGTVAVKEPEKADTEYVLVEAGKEAEIEKGKPVSVSDLKQQNLENIRRIKEEIKELREDIRRKFEEQREEIRKAVVEQKEANKQRVEDQKAMDKANVEAIKGSTKEQAEQIKGDISGKQEEAKEAVKQFEKPDVSGAKPTIKKFDVKKPGSEE
ncbi:MAG TPA: FecR domain-containing protein [Spirochaetota bacterium]|nr:FecR domain-containing protein [Spirochaetota bacterium]HPF05043.1 FecR domain-containing protein [Spirochaetota bacterium]HPJ41180.1 FecR domain-containing protein [Spirochaetota bacterium]HPR38165.1 FecR domain-containing protein [Spirochaetota bacterium]HRX47580.1 FecR domain-containing protein [Spirochaetota bacterium]